MKRRRKAHEVDAPRYLVKFNPADWPGNTPKARIRAFTTARMEYQKAHPGAWPHMLAAMMPIVEYYAANRKVSRGL